MALSTQPYKGARDFYPEDKRVQKYIFGKLRQTVESFGYEEYDAPILEPLDLYLAKSGEEIVNDQTYTFTDRGGRQVAIRPEMTPTVSRMVAAKRELLKSIEGLMPKAKFGIVVFNNSVARWQHSLVEANAKNKRLAAQFVERQNPQASTASFDALAAALEFDVEAIYFLTDGAPTCGKILAPVDIVRSVTGTNRVRRISIYTIGIAPGYPGSPTDAFLKKLAEENLGSYRRIDG